MLSQDAAEGQAAAVRHDIAAVARRYGDLLAVRLPEAAPAAAAAAGGSGGGAGGGSSPGGDPAEDAVPAADGEGPPAWEGDVVLSYRSLEAAERAAEALQGRVFDGKPLMPVVEPVN